MSLEIQPIMNFQIVLVLLTKSLGMNTLSFCFGTDNKDKGKA